MVAADIVEVRIVTGHVAYGRQVPYVAKNGDKEVISGVQRVVVRDGAYLGTLVGAEGTILYTPDRVIEQAFPVRAAGNAQSYALVSPDDTRYAVSTPPAQVFRKSRPIDLGRVELWAVQAPSEHTVYLRFPHPLREGAEYTLACPGGFLPDITFRHDPRQARSEAVHVGQIGFSTTDPVKIAFLSTWMGDGGGVTYPEALRFEVIDDVTNATVFTGTTRLSKAATARDEDSYARNYTKADIHTLDFSALDVPGRYRVSVEQIGCSFPFPIAPDVWERAFITSARGFLHQRSGIALGPPYTTYERPRPFHPDDGCVVYRSATSLIDTGNGLNTGDSNFGNLVKGMTSRHLDDAWGGYMDAGDWDRRIQHLEATRLLCELYLLQPEYFSQVSLNIPESSNDLPDILDEARFNLDCYYRMQTADGGIRGGIESEEHPRHGEASWQESLRVVAYAPDAWSSYRYAGVAAQLALALTTLDPGLHQQYAESAVRAMLWAEGEYANGVKAAYTVEMRDARNLAAADLYRLTGDEFWHDIFRETTVFTRAGVEMFVWQQQNQRHAAWVYCTTQRPGINQEIASYCREALLREADARVRSTRQTGFRFAKNDIMPPALVFAAPDGISLARAHALTGKDMYERALLLACQTGSGANPLNICYTTGVGERYPQHVLHVDARVSGQHVPPGLTVFGPMDPEFQREPHSKQFYTEVKRYVYPDIDDWPALESYWDVFWFPTQCEYTIHESMSPTAYAWGYLAGCR